MTLHLEKEGFRNRRTLESLVNSTCGLKSTPASTPKITPPNSSSPASPAQHPRPPPSLSLSSCSSRGTPIPTFATCQVSACSASSCWAVWAEHDPVDRLAGLNSSWCQVQLRAVREHHLLYIKTFPRLVADRPWGSTSKLQLAGHCPIHQLRSNGGKQIHHIHLSTS